MIMVVVVVVMAKNIYRLDRLGQGEVSAGTNCAVEKATVNFWQASFVEIGCPQVAALFEFVILK